MKVIYKAEDGSEFDKESNCRDYESACLETLKSLEDAEIRLNNLYEFMLDSVDAFDIEVAVFIIDNIQEINKILGVDIQQKVVFTDDFGEDYIAVEERQGCNGCAFEREHVTCNKAITFYACSSNKIIWIKK